jgi:hypothetical protein
MTNTIVCHSIAFIRARVGTSSKNKCRRKKRGIMWKVGFQGTTTSE